MPLFKCSKCSAMDNTATTSGYWWNKAQNLPVLCSECADGKWHGLFPKQTPEEAGYELGPHGYRPRGDHSAGGGQ